MTGRLAIQWIERDINFYLNKVLQTKNKDFIIAADTDSVYIDMESLVDKLNTKDELIIVKTIDEFCEKKIQPYIDSSYKKLAEYMNLYQHRLFMKRETIANKGIWKAKKMYMLNAWNIEGVQYDKPQLKMQGIEAVRSSTPQVCRKAIKEAISIIMNGTEEELLKYISEFKQKFDTLSFEQVAFPRGVKGLKKYSDKSNIYKKGTPIHVKGALLFNHFLIKYNIKNINPISDGDKIKFCYLKVPNPIYDTVISISDSLPTEFNLNNYIDRNMQFQKSFLEPIKSITNIIDWKVEKTSTLENFFG